MTTPTRTCPAPKRTPVPALKRWFDILFQKTLLMQEHERLGDDLLRHLFVSTIQHLQLGHSLLVERRSSRKSPFDMSTRFENFRMHLEPEHLEHLGDLASPPAAAPAEAPSPAPRKDEVAKVWWESEDRFQQFARMAKDVISKAYDLTADMPRWRHRDKSPLGKWLNVALILCKIKQRPKNSKDWDKNPNADEIFATSIQVALQSSEENLLVLRQHNLSFLLVDLESHLGVHPSWSA